MADNELPKTTEGELNEVEEVKETADTSSVAEENNKNEGVTLTAGEKTLSAIGYISFFCILPLVLKPKSDFCQHHGKQGLVLTLFFTLLSWVTWMGGPFVRIFFYMIWVVLAVLAIVNAIQGVKWKMPFVEKVAGKLDFS